MDSATTDTTTTLADCVELGEWTRIPVPPPASFLLKLKDVDADESQAIKARRAMSFHAVGCTGCHADQHTTTAVARVMAVQAEHPHRFGGDPAAAAASFLYHLGDVVYKHDKETAAEQSPEPEKTDFGHFYDVQFYAPYAPYTRPVFAIAGNHDGKDKDPTGPPRKAAIRHFLKNFCGVDDGDPPDNRSSKREPVRQPYPYWVLQTPLAYLIGLYTNVNNAGQLDDPQGDAAPQYDWLVRTLRDIKTAADGRAVLLAVHYPPYSAATNFRERGDPNQTNTPKPPGKELEPLGVLLQRAFQDSGQYPDAVLSAHAHHYQRLTYTVANGRQVPYLIAGAGGHSPVEKLTRPCPKDAPAAPVTGGRSPVVWPKGLSLPTGDRVELAAFNDVDFGFLRITLDADRHRLIGEYFRAFTPAPGDEKLPAPGDTFTVDLRSHTVG
jgi:hypothetical protein